MLTTGSTAGKDDCVDKQEWRDAPAIESGRKLDVALMPAENQGSAFMPMKDDEGGSEDSSM